MLFLFLSKIFHLLRNVIIVGEGLKDLSLDVCLVLMTLKQEKYLSHATSAMTRDFKSDASEGPPYLVALYKKPGVLPSYFNPDPHGNMRF